MPNETLNIQNGVSPITIDTNVTAGSTRPVMGGGIYEAIAAATEPFVVELTPTALDFSEGTMDKTMGEIYEAWLAGKRIRFATTIAGIGYFVFELTSVGGEENHAYPSFNWTGAMDFRGTPELMSFFTSYTDDATRNTWVASFFELTPAT